MSKSDIPCPFCGGDAYPYRFDSIFVTIQCATCKAQGPSVKIPMENFHEERKTWAQVIGKANKRALKRWARCSGGTNERPEENPDSHVACSSILGDVSRYEVSSDAGPVATDGKIPRKIGRFVPSRRRQNARDYERD